MALKEHEVSRGRMRKLIMRITVLLVAMAAMAAWSPRPPAAPDHLLLMVFDQMRPDYIDRFGLENFKRLRASSRHYPEAYVGHLSSQTVVAHMVIPTGLRPGALPWMDDVLVDVDGALGKPGLAYNTGKLTRPQA